jgi:hypothetical protein
MTHHTTTVMPLCAHNERHDFCHCDSHFLIVKVRLRLRQKEIQQSDAHTLFQGCFIMEQAEAAHDAV